MVGTINRPHTTIQNLNVFGIWAPTVLIFLSFSKTKNCCFKCSSHFINSVTINNLFTTLTRLKIFDQFCTVFLVTEKEEKLRYFSNKIWALFCGLGQISQKLGETFQLVLVETILDPGWRQRSCDISETKKRILFTSSRARVIVTRPH